MVRSVSKQALEPSRCQLGVTHRMLDRLVAEISLDRSGIYAVVGQFEAAGVAQHVRVDFISNPAASPARSTIASKPRLVNGVPRSDVKHERRL
jgi:hypothetical protein